MFAEAVGMHLFVDAQPRLLFFVRQQIHDLREVVYDVLPNFFYQRTSFFGYPNENFAPIIRGMGALDVAQILQAVHEAGCGRRRVVHLFGDFAHRKKVVAGDVPEQEKLRKRNLPA